jgi:Uri superfamily endonuclease
MAPCEIWYTHDSLRREHQWAKILANFDGNLIPLLGFGASDCRCPSHLFFSQINPSYNRFDQHVQTTWPDHASIQFEPVRAARR